MKQMPPNGFVPVPVSPNNFQQEYYELLIEYYIELEKLNDDLLDIQRLAKACQRKLGVRVVLGEDRD